MWTSLPNLSGPSPESQVSLNLLFSDITMTPHTRHTGLMSGLAVLSVLIVILPSVVLFLLCKKGEGRRFSHKVNVEMYLHFSGIEVSYPRWGGNVLCSRELVFLDSSVPHLTLSQKDSPDYCITLPWMVFQTCFWDQQDAMGPELGSKFKWVSNC